MSIKKKKRSLDQHPGPSNPDCAKAIRWRCSDSNERQTLEPLYIQMNFLFKCCQVHNQKTLLQNPISYLFYSLFNVTSVCHRRNKLSCPVCLWWTYTDADCTRLLTHHRGDI